MRLQHFVSNTPATREVPNVFQPSAMPTIAPGLASLSGSLIQLAEKEQRILQNAEINQAKNLMATGLATADLDYKNGNIDIDELAERIQSVYNEANSSINSKAAQDVIGAKLELDRDMAMLGVKDLRRQEVAAFGMNEHFKQQDILRNNFISEQDPNNRMLVWANHVDDVMARVDEGLISKTGLAEALDKEQREWNQLAAVGAIEQDAHSAFNAIKNDEYTLDADQKNKLLELARTEYETQDSENYRDAMTGVYYDAIKDPAQVDRMLAKLPKDDDRRSHVKTFLERRLKLDADRVEAEAEADHNDKVNTAGALIYLGEPYTLPDKMTPLDKAYIESKKRARQDFLEAGGGTRRADMREVLAAIDLGEDPTKYLEKLGGESELSIEERRDLAFRREAFDERAALTESKRERRTNKAFADTTSQMRTAIKAGQLFSDQDIANAFKDMKDGPAKDRLINLVKIDRASYLRSQDILSDREYTDADKEAYTKIRDDIDLEIEYTDEEIKNSLSDTPEGTHLFNALTKYANEHIAKRFKQTARQTDERNDVSKDMVRNAIQAGETFSDKYIFSMFSDTPSGHADALSMIKYQKTFLKEQANEKIETNLKYFEIAILDPLKKENAEFIVEFYKWANGPIFEYFTLAQVKSIFGFDQPTTTQRQAVAQTEARIDQDRAPVNQEQADGAYSRWLGMKPDQGLYQYMQELSQTPQDEKGTLLSDRKIEQLMVDGIQRQKFIPTQFMEFIELSTVGPNMPHGAMVAERMVADLESRSETKSLYYANKLDENKSVQLLKRFQEYRKTGITPEQAWQNAFMAVNPNKEMLVTRGIIISEFTSNIRKHLDDVLEAPWFQHYTRSDLREERLAYDDRVDMGIYKTIMDNLNNGSTLKSAKKEAYKWAVANVSREQLSGFADAVGMPFNKLFLATGKNQNATEILHRRFITLIRESIKSIDRPETDNLNWTRGSLLWYGAVASALGYFKDLTNVRLRPTEATIYKELPDYEVFEEVNGAWQPLITKSGTNVILGEETMAKLKSGLVSLGRNPKIGGSDRAPLLRESRK